MHSKQITTQPASSERIKKNPLIDRTHDKEREKLIKDHMWCVWYFGGIFFSWGAERGFNPKEIIQTGTVGLIKAIDKHDPKKGTIPAYAKYYIQGEIKNFLKTKGNLIRTISKKERAVVCNIDSVEHIGAASDEAGIEELMAISNLPLSDRTKTILALKISGMNHTEIGKIFGISEQRISQIIKEVRLQLDADCKPGKKSGDENTSRIETRKEMTPDTRMRKFSFDRTKSIYKELVKKAEIGKTPEEICDFLLKRGAYEISLAFRKVFPDITNQEIAGVLRAETNHFSLEKKSGEYVWKWKYRTSNSGSMFKVGLAEHIDPPKILMEIAEKIAAGKF
jgi:RNA polymerase sigma factor (sigma-70 family)